MVINARIYIESNQKLMPLQKLLFLGEVSNQNLFKPILKNYHSKIDKIVEIEYLIIQKKSSENETLEKYFNKIPIIKKNKILILITDKKGILLKSEDFAAFLGNSSKSQISFQEPIKKKIGNFFHEIETIYWVVGHAFGIDIQNLKINSMNILEISFGHLTLVHELAQLILLEQLYRGKTILDQKPYHLQYKKE